MLGRNLANNIETDYFVFNIAVLLRGAICFLVLAGCQTRQIAPILIEYKVTQTDMSEPNELIAAYGQVLEEYIGKDGRVDYQKLAADEQARGKLGDFLAWAGQVEAQKPEAGSVFQDGRQAFYINVYNACVWGGVLEFYPFKKLSEVGGDFYEDLHFVVAGESLSLNQIARRCGRDGDERVEFALAGPSRSDPVMVKTLYTAADLQQQLDEAVQNYIGSCPGLRVDHAQRRILLGKLLYERQGFFRQSYYDRYNIKGASLLSALASWSWPRGQELLADLAGYGVAEQKWDDRLNDAAQAEDEIFKDIDKLPCGIK